MKMSKMKWIFFVAAILCFVVYGAKVSYAGVSSEKSVEEIKEEIAEETKTITNEEIPSSVDEVEEASHIEEVIEQPKYVFDSYEPNDAYGVINVAGIESAIYVGSSKDGSDEKGLEKGAMLYDVSLLSKPVILGHNTSITAPDMYFSKLYELKEGDTVTITLMTGEVQTYCLTSSEWYSEEWYNEEVDERNQVLFNNGADLTLVTCRKQGERGRLIVQFELTEN